MRTNPMAEPSFLDSLAISEDVVSGPYFGIVYGPGGVGKTFLCKHAEKPFFIAVEKGVEKVKGVGKFLDADGSIYMPKNQDEFFEMLRKFTRKGHDYKTIVIDSGMFVDKLFVERIIADFPTETTKSGTKIINSIADYTFGKGFMKALAIWEGRFFAALNALHKCGINVILIAHSREKSVSDMGGDDYKKHGIDMLEFGRISVPNLLFAKCDWCLFMQSSVTTKKKVNPYGAAKTVIDSDFPPEIIVYTRGSSAWDAKIRTEIASNVQDQYVIDINDDETSKKLFNDLLK